MKKLVISHLYLLIGLAPCTCLFADVREPHVSDDPSAERLVVHVVAKNSFEILFTGALAEGESLSWDKDGERLESESQIKLSVPSATYDDTGVYRPVIKSSVAGVIDRYGQSLRIQVEPGNRFVNMSSRLELQVGSVAIIGFVVSGAHRTQYLVRAIGPSMARFGLSPAKIAKLTIYDAAGKIYGQQPASKSEEELSIYHTSIEPTVGAFPSNVGDVVTLTRFDPGIYTIHVEPAAGGSGIAMLEFYEVD